MLHALAGGQADPTTVLHSTNTCVGAYIPPPSQQQQHTQTLQHCMLLLGHTVMLADKHRSHESMLPKH
jgi:hypothetical protein